MNKPSNDFPHSDLPAVDLTLVNALHDIPIPDGLQSRLLASVTNKPSPSLADDVPAPTRGSSLFSRRAWLTSAAGLAGVSAIGGLVYSRRPLSRDEVELAVNEAWLSEKWSKVWQSMSSAPLSTPKDLLLKPRGWQHLETKLAEETVAFDLTQPGRPPAVLFSAQMWRDISGFQNLPTAPPKPAIHSGPWNRIAVWRQNRVLYVLASKGTKHDYDELFRSKGTALFA